MNPNFDLRSPLITFPQGRSTMTPEIKKETQDVKREAPDGELPAIKGEEGDVEVVSYKRLKRLPTRKDEVMVLDLG